MTNDARSQIMGSGSAAFSFNYRGDKIVGQILTEPKSVQQKVFGSATNELAFWPSGDPKMQVVFQVQTAWRNYEGINSPDRTQPDSGVRTVYLKGKHMEKAFKDAILAAGATWLDIGGMVSVEYVGDDLQSKAGIKPKLFAVRYQAPQGQVPAHMAQQSQPYRDQGYPTQQPPRPPQAPGPHMGEQFYQRYDHAPQNPAQAYAQHQQAQQPQIMQSPPMTQDPWATPTPVTPPHHGDPNAMPDWAQSSPTSAPPSAPTSVPPAPHLSTLDQIKQAGASGMPGFDTDEAGF